VILNLHPVTSHVGNLVSDDGNFLNWKRFLLLPIVLLSSKNKKLIKKRIMMILQDQWEDFKVCQFIQRDYRSTNSPSSNNNDGQCGGRRSQE
jgi:hypothetical protein